MNTKFIAEMGKLDSSKLTASEAIRLALGTLETLEAREPADNRGWELTLVPKKG